MSTLTPHQREAVDRAMGLMKKKQIVRFCGFAGTGKTTAAKSLGDEIEASGREVLYVAPTHKANEVLRHKGIKDPQIIQRAVYFHMLLNEEECLEAETTMRRLWNDQKHPEYIAASKVIPIYERTKLGFNPNLVFIIDESSMLTEDQLADAADVAGNIILVGDPAQLPPVHGKPVLVEGNHDICLTEPHRQGDQLFTVAQHIRSTGHFPGGRGEQYAMLKPTGLPVAELYDKSKIICATNQHRVSFNRRIREFLGFNHRLPLVDEVVMLFQSHGNIRSEDGSKIVSLHNGREFVVRGVNHNDHTIQLSPLFNPGIRLPWLPFYPDEVGKPLHNQRFDDCRRTLNLDYCYAITCHKSQGSEWDSVVIKDGFAKDRKRWAYTAATRARKELIVI